MSNNEIISTIVLALIILIVYYFGTFQKRKQEKELKSLQDNLKNGDKVITTSGLAGEIDEILDDRVIIKTYPDSVKISVEKWSIVALDERNIDNNRK